MCERLDPDEGGNDGVITERSDLIRVMRRNSEVTVVQNKNKEIHCGKEGDQCVQEVARYVEAREIVVGEEN